MPVRPLSPTDVVGLASFERRAGLSEISAQAWSDPSGGGKGASYLRLASLAVAQQIASHRAWLLQRDGPVEGLLVACPRRRGLAWDVERLHAADDSGDAAVELLDHLAGYASSRQALRVFMETTPVAPCQGVARRAGFDRYASSTLYSLAPGAVIPPGRTFIARPREASDDHALFQLYQAAVPATVRAAEAMSMQEWRGLERAQAPWRNSWARTRRRYVWELGTTLVGCMTLTFTGTAQLLEMLVHPGYEDSLDALLGFALTQVSQRAPVHVPVREYQALLEPAVEALGFQPVAVRDLFVRLLAQRVPEAALVRANLAGGLN